ncbi:MAG: GNAT family N-acetyltransferase [Clostridia bacterium]
MNENKIEVVAYTQADNQAVLEISLEWLRKYDLLEAADYIYLNDPYGEAIGKGGHVFMARLDGKIVGTAALVPVDPDTVEILKYGVKESAQGCGVGRALLEQLITTAKKEGWKKIILCSNHQLEAALHLYLEFGFTYTAYQKLQFELSDVSMELFL